MTDGSTLPFDTNRLAGASSPYLRQHAGNPVHWQQWNAATLAHARATDTPILLSIGYSACHWCHVMAHECFENPAIADAMNAGFVSIKLDREERPDIDHVYQLAHQALSQRGGGWPLTAFLDPQDLAPFYIGTYFPPEPRHGLPGFPEVLARVRAWFDSHREDLRAQAGRLQQWLQQVEAGAAATPSSAAAADATALRNVGARFDPVRGGTRGGPKFPRATELEWLLDLRTDPARRMAHLTLAQMASRGLQDQLGGGFFRYCVDADWTIPHFEKMLYDNAQLLPVYARVAADTTADAPLRAQALDAASGAIGWLAQEMTAPDGTFYSSLDADSEHAEGKFYLWTREALQAALPDGLQPIAAAAYGFDQPPNFEGTAWHLLRDAPLSAIAERLHLSPTAAGADLATARRALFDARARRVRPARDDKHLTAWNALAIAGLARASRLLADPRPADMAMHALATLRKTVWIDGALCANVADPGQRIPGFLDDHALLLDALLETLQLRFSAVDLGWAIALADALLANFEDHANGGFWFAATQHATPLARGRSLTDDTLPNGNGVAIRSLLRLGHLLGRTDYLDAAARALHAAGGALGQYPEACPTLLRALHEYERPRAQIVIRCNATQAAAWRDALASAPSSGPRDVFAIPADLDDLPGVLAARTADAATGTAWLCEGTTCRAPITSPRALATALRQT
ncbi:MAG TPA: thioredoxin domain-containing protein [Rhodanobacteraceae bacterium]